MTADGAVARCDYCAAPRRPAEVFEPYPGATRCRDVAGCKQRQVYAGSYAEPPARTAAAVVPGATCSICGATDPPGGAYQRTAHVFVCLDRPGCDSRAVDSQFLTAHRDDSAVEYTSAMMRAVAAASVAQVAADVPAEAAEARQAAAQADHAYSLAAAARSR